MSVIWKYLDKRAATVAAIKDYDSMKFIIDHTTDEIRAEGEKMTGMPGLRLGEAGGSLNVTAAEDRIIAGIEEIDVLKERYRQAAEYMEWFTPAWGQLSEDERDVLGTFYCCGADRNGAVYEICDRYHIERSSAYNKKNRALSHLRTLLFGRG